MTTSTAADRATLSRVRAKSGPVGHDGKSATPLFLDEHTEEELERYLDLVRSGVGLWLAAGQIGLTKTRMNNYMSREPELRARIEEAYEDGEYHFADRLSAALRVIALRTDPGEVVPRLMEVALASHGGPRYAHLKRDRVRHEGRIEHGIVLDLDPEKLDALPPEKLRALRTALADLEGEIVDAEATEIRELPAA